MNNSVILEILSRDTCVASCGHCQYGVNKSSTVPNLDAMKVAYSELASLDLVDTIGVAGGEGLRELGFIEPRSVRTFWATLQEENTATKLLQAGVSETFLTILKRENGIFREPNRDQFAHLGIKVVDDFGTRSREVGEQIGSLVSQILGGVERYPDFTKLTLRLGVNDLASKTRESYLATRMRIMSRIYSELMKIPGLVLDFSSRSDNPGIFSIVLNIHFQKIELEIAMRYIRPLRKDQDFDATETEILEYPLLPVMLTPREVRFFHSTYNINDPAYAMSYQQFSQMIKEAEGSKEKFIALCIARIRSRVGTRNVLKPRRKTIEIHKA